ncbi:hypothetical protein O6H91_05G045100 [Diphasiastrum complanatum]|uniref:Uncharacterized protein n=1 Tax=Diphasiastrum complanatum TaxID=34168 RepID=A0ACC2DNJ3_DIPCM|nr:hypothetical protein O6H91_05G045100 [Diphasiastrum complanatum]
MLDWRSLRQQHLAATPCFWCSKQIWSSWLCPSRILACALYNNWWPMLTALMYVLVPMPCLFFGGPSDSFISTDGGNWVDAAKFLTGFSAVGSLAIPAILRHAQLIGSGALIIQLTSFFILVCTVLLFQRVNQENDW